MKNNFFKYIKIIILFIVIFAIISILIIHSNNNHEENISKSNTFEGFALKCGYLDLENYYKKIIKNRTELENFCNKHNGYTYDGNGNILDGTLNKLLEKYDDSFFKSNNLAIKYIVLTSGGDSIDFIKATRISSNKLNIEYNANMVGITDDMNGYFLVVEIDKDIISIN